MFWVIMLVFILLWLIALLGNIGGSLIHLLLIAAFVFLLVELFGGRRQ